MRVKVFYSIFMQFDPMNPYYYYPELEFVYSGELEAWHFGILIIELYQPDNIGPNIYNYMMAVM